MKCIPYTWNILKSKLPTQDFISETHLVTLGQLINMFAVLDQLKDIKASISNDFTHYKRSVSYYRC